MRHFWSLSRQRRQSMGPLAITEVEIETHYRIYKLDEFLPLLKFVEWICELDKAYIKFYMDKAERERNA